MMEKVELPALFYVDNIFFSYPVEFWFPHLIHSENDNEVNSSTISWVGYLKK